MCRIRPVTSTFNLYAGLTCSGTATSSQTVAIAADGTAESSTTTAAADLSYQAVYAGDANYPAHTGACEPLHVIVQQGQITPTQVDCTTSPAGLLRRRPTSSTRCRAA